MAKKAKKTAVRRPRNAKVPALTAEQIFRERLRFRTVRLIDLHSHLEMRGGKVPSQAKFSFGASVGKSPDNNVNIDTTLILEGRPEGDGEAEDSSIVSIKVHYQCVFEIIEGTFDDVLKFDDEVAKIGMFVAWPYFRELVQSITSRMAIPAFTMPMFTAHGLAEKTINMERIAKPMHHQLAK